MMNKIAIYIHIPFCVKKCNYCDFLSFSCDDSVRKAYLDKLIEEMDFYRKGILKDYEISSIFVGGGTPSVLRPDELGRLSGALLKFSFSKDLEFSMELNPGTLDREKLDEIYRMGVNRLSIGLQSTIDEELRSLGRIHTYKDFLRTYEMVRNKGFSNVNIDIMSTIPKQDLRSYEKSLKRVVALRPEHISSYSLIVEEGTNLAKMIENGEAKMPDEDLDRDLYELTLNYLKEEGYNRYEISNYSLEGYECRHNITYWTMKPYIGMGLGAASFFENRRFSNVRSMKDYLDISFSEGWGSLPDRLEEDKKLSDKEKMEETMFLGLRLMRGVSKADFYNVFKRSMDDVYGGVIETMIKKGLLYYDKNDDRIALSKKGIDLSNYVFESFLLD